MEDFYEETEQVQKKEDKVLELPSFVLTLSKNGEPISLVIKDEDYKVQHEQDPDTISDILFQELATTCYVLNEEYSHSKNMSSQLENVVETQFQELQKLRTSVETMRDEIDDIVKHYEERLSQLESKET